MFMERRMRPKPLPAVHSEIEGIVVLIDLQNDTCMHFISMHEYSTTRGRSGDGWPSASYLINYMHKWILTNIFEEQSLCCTGSYGPWRQGQLEGHIAHPPELHFLGSLVSPAPSLSPIIGTDFVYVFASSVCMRVSFFFRGFFPETCLVFLL